MTMQMTTEYWIALAVAVGVIVVVTGVAVYLMKRRQPGPIQVLRNVAIESAHDVVVPNGMGGQIQIEHLLLTAKGVVVVDAKEFVGRIFASDLMDEWTVIGPEGRYTFPNPQITLYDRVAAVRRLLRDEIPVQGHVLFSVAAEFNGGRPGAVILADEFAKRYGKPEKAELESLTVELRPCWDRIRDVMQAA